MPIISSRQVQLYGELSESSYEAGRYYLTGQALDEILTDLQREAFVFVARILTSSETGENSTKGNYIRPDTTPIGYWTDAGILV